MESAEYKDVIKFAIANEFEAQKFYQAAADRVQDPHLKAMFSGFAAEEKKHAEILTGVLSHAAIGKYFHEGSDFKVSETVDRPKLSTDMKPADAIALAMKNEEDAMRQYGELAAACSDPEKKKVFLDLAAMEKGHKLKMEKAFVDIGYPEVW
jgi:rubrerythrin